MVISKHRDFFFLINTILSETSSHRRLFQYTIFYQNPVELYINTNMGSKIIVTSVGKCEVGIGQEYTKPTQSP